MQLLRTGLPDITLQVRAVVPSPKRRCTCYALCLLQPVIDDSVPPSAADQMGAGVIHAWSGSARPKICASRRLHAVEKGERQLPQPSSERTCAPNGQG
jgi:hypothetical protein